jgi:sulfopyruvate decarboxylase TPP-binding subunit
MSQAWQHAIFDALMAANIRQVAYVPDSGHAEVIRRAHAAPEMQAVPLTTEEEGVAMLCGAWLGGERGVLLMQSSGVGNCVNMFSLVKTCRFPFLALVTMRGEWGEFNPWQNAMSAATPAAFASMDILTQRLDDPEMAEATVAAASRMVFEGGAAMAVLIAQRLIGSKDFRK